MAVRRVLNRLLRLRQLEEEQGRLELEAAIGNRNRVAQEHAAAVLRHAQGRRDFANAIPDKDTAGRSGALMEVEQARRQRLRIEPRLEVADAEVSRKREEFIGRRTGMRQVEALVDQERLTTREEAARRAQQMLDDWYGRRGPKERTGAGSSVIGGSTNSSERMPDVASPSRISNP